MSGTSAGLTSRLITEPSGIDEIEDAWRALAERRSNAFVTPEWLRASWEAQDQPGASLLVVAVSRADGALAGVMPLALDSSRRPHAIRFAGASLGDRFHPVAEAEDEAAVAASAIAALRESGAGSRLLLLEHVDPEAAWLQQLRDSSGLALIERSRDEMPYIPLDGLDWETYVSQRSSKFRSQIRRRERVMIRDHEMKVRLADEGTLEKDLDDFFRLHALRWSGRDESPLLAPVGNATLRAFAELALHRGWLRLQTLEAEGEAVATFLGWRVGGSYASYNTGFDPAWSKRAVGTVMTSVAIRTAIEEGADEFDFLLGTESYKRDFAPTSRTSATVVLTGALRPSRLMIAGEARARRLGARLAKRPALARVARSVARVLPTQRG